MSEYEGVPYRNRPLLDAPPFIHALYDRVIEMLGVYKDPPARAAIASLYAWILTTYPPLHPDKSE